MEKAGWLGWPFSVASRGDCAIGIRKDQPGYRIDNYTINILCLNIVYPSVRVYSKSIHIYIYIHTSFTIFTYIYIMFVHLDFKYKYDHYITYYYSNTCPGCLARSCHEVGWASNYFVFLLGRGHGASKKTTFTWSHVTIHRQVSGFHLTCNLKLKGSWDLSIWPEAFERDHYMSTKDVERWFNEPILHLLFVNCPYPSYALYSKLLQSCRVCIQINTISSIYLHIIIDIFYVYIYYYSILDFHVQFPIIAKTHLQCSLPHSTPPGCWFTRNVVKHSTQRPWLPNWCQTNSWQYDKLNDLTLVTWVLLWRGGWGGRWKEMICFLNE